MIHTLTIPTPFQVGAVNAYLIEDDPLTLVDSGPNSAQALDALEQALAAHGVRVEDLGLLLITHQHPDHIGLAEILARRSGAEVAGLRSLASWIGDYTHQMELDDRYAEKLMARHGVPADVRLALRAVAGIARGWGAAATITRPLDAGDELRLRDRTLHVLHRPGHSPTDTLFHDPERGELIGGDHLIGHISSNPVITRPSDESGERPRALLTYLASMRETRAMDQLDRILPGHGDPVDDHVGLIDQRFRMHDRRAEKIHGLIADEPLTAHEIAQRLWGKVALTQAYLTLSEVLGHLDLLADRGRLAEEPDGDVLRFRAA